MPKPLIKTIDFKVKNKISEDVLSRWENNANLKADEEDEDTISILDVIGQDYFGEGVTAKRISAALRKIGEDKDIKVIINSPGGSVFEGIAIYNLLAQHKGKIKVNVIGLAASAASLIAMAGDDIVMGESAFLMIHNAWGCVCGNKNDMREAADVFDKFDASLKKVYAKRTGLDEDEITKMLDEETWLNSSDALEKGFVDSVIESKKTENKKDDKQEKALAKRKIELALNNLGLSKKEREEIFKKAGVSDSQKQEQSDSVEAKDYALLIEAIKN